MTQKDGCSFNELFEFYNSLSLFFFLVFFPRVVAGTVVISPPELIKSLLCVSESNTGAVDTAVFEGLG